MNTFLRLLVAYLVASAAVTYLSFFEAFYFSWQYSVNSPGFTTFVEAFHEHNPATFMPLSCYIPFYAFQSVVCLFRDSNSEVHTFLKFFSAKSRFWDHEKFFFGC